MNSLIPIEHKSQRVLTTQQLAEIYETETNNIHKNYSNNESRFIEGEHYHVLKGDELQAFKRSLNDIPEPLKYAPSLFLWTEKGASRHCKILDTDMAWKRFDELEETYFKLKENQIDVSRLSPELQMVTHLLAAASKLEAKVERLESTTQTIKDTMAELPKDQWRKWVNASLGEIGIRLGNKGQNHEDLRSDSYKLLEEKAGADLSTRLRNGKKRLEDAGATKTAQKEYCKLDCIEEDKRLKEIYTGIIKELRIKHLA